MSLLVGVAYQPDVGTAADLHSAALTDPLVGTNHAKPLPRLVTVADILRTVAPALLALVVLVQLSRTSIVRTLRGDGRHRSVFRSLVRARRGPPALALG